VQATIGVEQRSRFRADQAVDVLRLQVIHPLGFRPVPELGVIDPDPGIHVSEQEWILGALRQLGSHQGYL
jgi:hypothetical protein